MSSEKVDNFNGSEGLPESLGKSYSHKESIDLKEAVVTETPYGLDPETNRRLLRKTDLYLCPLMMLVYAIQYMDKTTNSSASIMGLREDLHMASNDYSWTGTAFYLGYMAFEFPAVYLLQRLPLIRTLSAFIILWGIVLCLHATPNFPGFIALRTILGMLESAVTPPHSGTKEKNSFCGRQFGLVPME